MTAGFPEPHCAQNSELMAKVAQFVQCTKVACKKEQMGQTMNSFRSEEEVSLQIFRVEKDRFFLCNSPFSAIASSSDADLLSHGELSSIPVP